MNDERRIFQVVDSGIQKFNPKSCFFWHGEIQSGILKTQCYPFERTCPALIANITIHDPLIVQGQYAWSANISHGLFDVLSDFLILRNYARIKSIKSKPALPALGQLLTLFDVETDESSVMALSINDDMRQDKALSWIENPWRFCGHKHPYICDTIRKSFANKVVKENNTIVSTGKYGVILNRNTRSSIHPLGRNLANPYELASALSDRYFRFEVVELEDMDVQQQIILFRNADAIIGCHGSGLVWLNFCKPHIPVIEIQTPYFMKTGIPKHDFWLISQANNLNHAIYSCVNITGEPLDPYNVRANVDIDTLSAILDELLIG